MRAFAVRRPWIYSHALARIPPLLWKNETAQIISVSNE